MPPRRRSAALAAVLVVGLAACSGDSEPSSTPLTAADGGSSSSSASSATTAPSEGCRGADPGLGPEEVVRSINSGGTQRGYRLAVPADADGSTPLPLVLNFHGSGSTAEEQSVYSRLPAVGTERGAIVVTPDAIANNWQLSSPSDEQNPDIRLTRDILEELSAELCVDERRVFAAGMSLGAAFSALLACALPDGIAAIGLVTVEVLIGPCPNSVPVVAFHGTADGVVPYRGGEVQASELRGRKVEGTEQNMRNWAELDGCEVEPEQSAAGSEVTRRVYADCDDGAEVQLYTIDGGGHTWPGSPIEVAYLGATTDQVDATDLILDFFEEHPLPDS